MSLPVKSIYIFSLKSDEIHQKKIICSNFKMLNEEDKKYQHILFWDMRITFNRLETQVYKFFLQIFLLFFCANL